MKFTPRITIAKLNTFGLACLILLLGLLFYLIFHASENALIRASNQLRTASSRELAEKISDFLSLIKQAENDFQMEINHKIYDPKDSQALETAFFTLMLANDNFSEMSLTFGKKTGVDAKGNILLAQSGRGKMRLFRTSPLASSPINTHILYQQNGEWISEVRERSAQNDLFSPPFIREETTLLDPTINPAFKAASNTQNVGKTLWGDLHWAKNEKKVEVSMQKAVTDSDGNFLGVLQIGLFNNQIEKITQFKLDPNDPNDPHIIFITDRSGELITRLGAKDALGPVQASLKDPLFDSRQFSYQGKTYLVTYRKIENSPGWILGIVVPESYYLQPLEEMRRHLLYIAGAIILTLCFGGFFVQRILKKEEKKILSVTSKMHDFDFQAFEPASLFQDVFAILSGLELAKTAMRAMSKYVPVKLVKQLYQSQKEPMLGGEIQEVSILFTDIQNFTPLAEKLPVNDLAAELGEYFKVMTQVIQNKWQGTIDKYIGDGILALWNTPEPMPNHAHMACEAVLDCSMALKELFASSQWKGLPPFKTRFGLHKDKVMVGHFGAPDRLNFTALGNGVNIASRLEGLSKYYGTSILVSENVYRAAQKGFIFRLLDYIILKGETEGIFVYELIGRSGEKPEMASVISKYEEAFAATRSRRFKEAMHLLEDQLQDEPSRLLYDRSSSFLQNPPPDSWNGATVFTEK